MSLQLVSAISAIESEDDLHLGRLLLLLREAFTRKDTTVQGLSKLAKLDFFLRYPLYLHDALNKLGRPMEGMELERHELTTVEASMVRYLYGPWDFRYRKWIELLVAKKLVKTFIKGRTIHVGLTELGAQIAVTLSNNEEFKTTALRSKHIFIAFGSKSGKWLTEFLFQTFPELVTLEFGEDIP